MASGIGINIKIEGLDDLIDRMQEFPTKMRRLLRFTMRAALDVMHENIPPYPAPPVGSTYKRTGTLGKSFGVAQQGTPLGQPDIKQVRVGGRGAEGTFGSRLNYAEYVVGERETEQAEVHRGRWWTLKEAARDATGKIEAVFESMADEIARFLDKGV